MKEFAPLIGSFWYLLRGAGMTVLMAASAVAPATLLGILLALLSRSDLRRRLAEPDQSYEVADGQRL